MIKIDIGDLCLIVLIVAFGICIVKYPDRLIQAIVNIKSVITTILK